MPKRKSGEARGEKGEKKSGTKKRQNEEEINYAAWGREKVVRTIDVHVQVA